MNAMHRDLAKLTALAEEQPVDDKWRPGFHLAPPVGWLNDPNGLCRLGDWYHVFYQYSPFDPEGGLKLWGHFRSEDLLHWEQMPTALFPDQPWDCHGVYSGSALAEDGILYLYYTGNVKLSGAFDYISRGREHNTCLAISRDGGETFPEKHLLMKNSDYPEGLTCHVRDPKVWREGERCFMLQGARTLEDKGEVLLFQSDDLYHWTHCNTFTTDASLGYMWECPDLFRLEGQTFLSISPQGLTREETRFQNIYQSGYLPLQGQFDGAYSLGAFQEFDYGFDFYAPQTFDDNGRRILIGWMGMPDADPEYTNPTAALGWQHCLTVPRELYVKKEKLCQRPVAELAELRKEKRTGLVQGVWELEEARVFDLELERAGETPFSTEPFSMVIRRSAQIQWENGILSLSFLKGGSGRGVRKAVLKSLTDLRILADESSLEIFVNGGELVMTSRYYPEEGDHGISVVCESARVVVWEMPRQGEPGFMGRALISLSSGKR